MKGDSDSIKGLVEEMGVMGAHIAQVTPCNHAGKPIFTLLLIDHPDAQEMADLKALQEKWEAEGDAEQAPEPVRPKPCVVCNGTGERHHEDDLYDVEPAERCRWCNGTGLEKTTT